MLLRAALAPALPWQASMALPARLETCAVVTTAPRYKRVGGARPSRYTRHLADWDMPQNASGS